MTPQSNLRQSWLSANVQPYYADDRVAIYHGDSRDLLPERLLQVCRVDVLEQHGEGVVGHRTPVGDGGLEDGLDPHGVHLEIRVERERVLHLLPR